MEFEAWRCERLRRIAHILPAGAFDASRRNVESKIGSSGERICLSCGDRSAKKAPDAGTTDLPAPIHGDVHAAYEVRRIQTGSGTRLLISPSSQDAKIQFTAAPGSGLSAFDENALAVQVRKVLREDM